jgi:hypothetical protein
MKAIVRSASLAAAALLVASCASPDAAPTDVAEVVRIPVYAMAGDATHLDGETARPTPIDTKAVGEFVMQIADDRQSASFRLIASNIQNVTQAHIHLRSNATAASGGIVVWLYPAAPPAVLIPGRSSGVLSEGTFTAANFSGALANQPFSALLAKMEAELTYVNVHTTAHPPGEISGDIIL